jgi:hypothetical protein
MPPAEAPAGAPPGVSPVLLDAGGEHPLAAAFAHELETLIWFGEHVDATIDLAVELGRRAPAPAAGRTADLWSTLATASRADVAGARVIEPHLDALAILSEARAHGVDVDAALHTMGAGRDSSWGVFAAEGPGTRLEASPAPEGGWMLSGTKPWCSLAARLTHALVTAWVSPGDRALFAVPLRHAGVHAQRAPWFSRGLAQIVSAPVDFDEVPAAPIGEPGWYLERPGFAWGGIGVAAAWWGGALPLRDALAAAAADDRADQFAAIALGDADARLWAAQSALARAAAMIDAAADHSPLTRTQGRILVERTRAVVADAVERVLDLTDRALGPRPLTTNEAHARRVADLRVYLRQHHGERDLARLGMALAAAPDGVGTRA